MRVRSRPWRIASIGWQSGCQRHMAELLPDGGARGVRRTGDTGPVLGDDDRPGDEFASLPLAGDDDFGSAAAQLPVIKAAWHFLGPFYQSDQLSDACCLREVWEAPVYNSSSDRSRTFRGRRSQGLISRPGFAASIQLSIKRSRFSTRRRENPAKPSSTICRC